MVKNATSYPRILLTRQRASERVRFARASAHQFAVLVSESKIEAQNIVRWIEANRVLYGRPFSFQASGPHVALGDYDKPADKMQRPYLLQYLNDQAPERSVIKPRQSEMTVNSINELLFFCLTRPYTQVAHIFPTDSLGDEISNEKIATAIRESPRILQQVFGEMSVRRYVFSTQSMYHVTGAWKRSGGRGGSRDILFFDEVDQIPSAVIPVYLEQMSHSALRLARYLSTPTTPLVGIDAIVGRGAGYTWHWTCHKCKTEQTFTWPDSIINYFEPSAAGFDSDDPDYVKKLRKAYIGCKSCGEYCDRNSAHYVATSRWVAERPHIAEDRASYKIVGAMIPWKTGRELLASAHTYLQYPHTFQNEVWGQAYMKGESRLSIDELYRLQRPWQAPDVATATMARISMGIDHGETQSWVVVTCDGFDSENPSLHCVVYVEEISEETLRANGYSHFAGMEHVHRMKTLIQRWKPERVVSDIVGIGSDRTLSLIRAFPRITWGGMFDTAEAGRQLRQSRMLVPKWSEDKKRTVTFSKVNLLKDIMGTVRAGRWGLPLMQGAKAREIDLFCRHATGLGVQPRYDATMDREFEVVAKLSPNDHLLCAWMYARVGWMGMVGMKQHVTPGVIV